jgi:hypothetical protein
MAIIVGAGDFKYRIVEDWARLADGWSFKEVGAVGVDAKDVVSTLKTMSTSSIEGNTRSSCSIARAISCAPGARDSIRGLTMGRSIARDTLEKADLGEAKKSGY